jgi:outer membrane protein OmpA-like peptidoglycan-associated protein
MRAISSPVTKRRLLAGLIAVGIVPTLAACGAAGQAAELAEPTAATAFVVGGRGNMPQPRLDGDAREAAARAVDAEAMASVVVADGKPSVLDSRWLRITGATSHARDATRQENRAKIETGIRSARADDEESDLLAALDLAAREVSSIDGPREIVVVDSGLATAGEIDFTQPGLLDAEPEDVVADLQASDMLPNLCGIRVTVQGLGDTASPQDPLDIAQRKQLIRIWEAVLLASCAEDVSIEQRALGGPAYDDVPGVTPVPLPEPVRCSAGTVVLSGGEVGFRPDSAEFSDTAAARAVLAPIAAQMVRDGVTATVTGTTANWRPIDGQVTLSSQRAQTVVDELVALGVPRESLSAEGVGSNFPEYVPDGGPEGPLDPAAAAQNRKVIIQLLQGAFTCE